MPSVFPRKLHEFVVLKKNTLKYISLFLCSLKMTKCLKRSGLSSSDDREGVQYFVKSSNESSFRNSCFHLRKSPLVDTVYYNNNCLMVIIIINLLLRCASNCPNTILAWRQKPIPVALQLNTQDFAINTSETCFNARKTMAPRLAVRLYIMNLLLSLKSNIDFV